MTLHSGIRWIFGILLMLLSLSMLPPLGVSLWYGDGEAQHFLSTLLVTFGGGLLLWLPLRKHHRDLRKRDGFVIVALFWLIMSFVSAVPFMIGPHLSLTDSVFEAASGFTTTGATVIVGLERLPPSVLYYRQQIQWLGGLGVVVLAVAILPMLGVGGMQLYRMETPGPMKEEKITPRIAHTARSLWLVYLSLTAACAVCYWLAGMSPFDAIGHSFSTISTGGFSLHDQSLAYYDSPAVEVVADVFMVLGGVNFSVHFLVWRALNPGLYLRDDEVRTYVTTVLLLALCVAIALSWLGAYPDFLLCLRYALFQVASIITSTGYTTADFSAWPLALPALLIFSSFIGGCAGSSAGGLKVIRVLLLLKQGSREIARLLHPNAVLALKINGMVVPERTMEAVWGFFSVYLVTFAVIMLLMMFAGLDQVSAFGAVATCMNNLGPGLGRVSANFASVSQPVKWLGVLAMLLGRLEIFTLLVLLSPNFWRR
jgi:trk system potassium uptake protein TrkH